ncbi:MAG: TolC family protein [Bacteroidota bacterium]
MRAITFLLFLSVALLSAKGQDTLTLDRCLDDAVRSAPRAADAAVIRENALLKQENIGTGWLPSLSLSGKATWQSDVVELSIENAPFPIEFPAIPHDQYSITLDIRQLIYDGGLTRKMKELEENSAGIELKQVDVDLFLLKDQVNQLFFSILLLQENRRNLALTMENLKEREKNLECAVKNGVSTENDLSVLRVEILRLLQAMNELDSRRNALLASLGILMGCDLSGDVFLDEPYPELAENMDIQRPELDLFLMQQQMLDASIALKKTERMPKLFAFGQAGYGRPGYNMLSSDFNPYYMAGLTFQWNIWDWKKNSRERQILEQKKQIVSHAEDQFRRQLSLLTSRELAAVEQYRKALDLDEHILDLQKKVSANAASQLENGTLSSSSYLIELNRETGARISASLHRIQMRQAMANILILNGNL